MLHPLESGGGGTAGRIGNGVGRACVGAGRCWRRSLCWGACLGAGRCRNRVGVGLVAESVPVGAGVGWVKKGCELLGGLLGASWWPPASWWRPGGLLVASCLLRPPPQVCVKNRSFFNSATKCNEVRVALSNVMRCKTKAHCKAHGNDLKVSE